jgi:hypothetical protein
MFTISLLNLITFCSHKHQSNYILFSYSYIKLTFTMLIVAKKDYTKKF